MGGETKRVFFKKAENHIFRSKRPILHYLFFGGGAARTELVSQISVRALSIKRVFNSKTVSWTNNKFFVDRVKRWKQSQ